jgi:hypothetical protein
VGRAFWGVFAFSLCQDCVVWAWAKSVAKSVDCSCGHPSRLPTPLPLAHPWRGLLGVGRRRRRSGEGLRVRSVEDCRCRRLRAGPGIHLTVLLACGRRGARCARREGEGGGGKTSLQKRPSPTLTCRYQAGEKIHHGRCCVMVANGSGGEHALSKFTPYAHTWIECGHGRARFLALRTG